MAKANKSEFKSHKEMAARVLAAQGIRYEEWLDGQHQKVIADNAKTIEAALNLLITSKSKTSQEKG